MSGNRRLMLLAVLFSLVASPTSAQSTWAIYTGSQTNGCGNSGTLTATGSSGQAVCNKLEAWDTMSQPSCAIPGTNSSATYYDTGNGGSCVITCVNQAGLDCGVTTHITASIPPQSPKDMGPKQCPEETCGDPIVMAAANKVKIVVDYRTVGTPGLEFIRNYNSSIVAGTADSLAPKWMHNYASSITPISVSEATRTYTGSVHDGCGTRGNQLASSATGQGACDQIEAFAISDQPACSIPANASAFSDVYQGDTSGGSCNITCTNQGGGNCSFSVPISSHLAPTTLESASTVVVNRPDGRALTFTQSGNSWTSDADVNDTLVQTTDGTNPTGWQYTIAADDSSETYDVNGKLLSINRREGTSVSLAYATSTTATASSGQLVAVTDSFGRSISFAYSNGVINTVTDANNGLYTFSYSGPTNLASVTYPDSTAESYLYNESAYTGNTSQPSALTGVVDGNGARYDSTWYAANGDAIQTSLAGGVDSYSTTSTTDSTGRIQSVSLTEPLGATSGRVFESVQGRNRLTGVTRTSSDGASTVSESIAFDNNGNTTQTSDFNGNLQCAVFDQTRNLEIARIEGIAPNGTCPADVAGYTPAIGTVERKISTQWHPIWHLESAKAAPLKISRWVYNGDGGVFCAPNSATVMGNPIGVLCSYSEQATADATGASGFSATTVGTPRVWYFTYSGFGQVLTATGPRTDLTQTTSYTYYNCSTGAECGQVQTVTNALGQTTQFLSYDGNGRPLSIQDANGLTTALTYWPRGWLKTVTVGAETTSYDYDGVGQLKKVTLPSGAYLAYTYDPAHRLTDIVDAFANKVHYTLDAAGNRTQEQVTDPGNTLTQTRSRVFNSLSWLIQDIGAISSESTSYAYDNNGNLTSVTDPLNHVTGNQYDALNRLVQVTDPGTGVTHYGYDGLDQIRAISDPRSLTTSYSINGLGNVGSLQSPDTGTTVNTYDDAGNVITRTDAKQQATSYQYDALNRLTQITRADSSQIVYSYDDISNGNHGIGHLTGMTDPSGSTRWTYDLHGRLTSKTQVTGGQTLTTAWGYDSAGQLTSTTLPSSSVIGYGWTNGRISSITLNGTALVSNLQYQPFSGPKAWTFANGEVLTKSYDLDGRITEHPLGTIGYDDASRVNSIANGNRSVNAGSKGYDYDPLDRLINVALGASVSPLTYAYDATGNRTNQSGTTSPMTYTIDPASNRIQTIVTGTSSLTPSYDANGSLTQDINNTYGYDAAGRLATANGASYQYNGQGQRTQKVIGSLTTHFAYDNAGHLLGEYDSHAGRIEETIWLSDQPIAVLRTGSVYYVHADHLNTPRQIDDSNGNAVWAWDTVSFGATAPNDDPQNTGSHFVYNLRMPGQYYDAESGLFQNNRRDYDPATGRYIESDPIGLAGGLNTFAYVASSPLKYIDPLGLAGQEEENGGRGRAPLDPSSYSDELIADQYAELLSQVQRMDPTFQDPVMSASGARYTQRDIARLQDALRNSDNAGYCGSGSASPVGRRGFPMTVQPRTNRPTNIGGRDYTGHALDSMQGRGLPPSVIEDAIRNGEPSPGNQTGTTVYSSPANGVNVIVDTASGRVITAY